MVDKKLSQAIKSRVNGMLNAERPGLVPFMFKELKTLDAATVADPAEVARNYHNSLKNQEERLII